MEIKDEYVIINKTAIQKRIEELEKTTLVREKDIVEYEVLKYWLNQSTPLIPEIEKAFDEGQNRMQHEIIERLGLRYQTEQISQSTILNMEVHSEDYIANLKLDI
jgi:hypothetical protein